jgi:uncharacterized protein YhbP (UPF0306 family)
LGGAAVEFGTENGAKPAGVLRPREESRYLWRLKMVELTKTLILDFLGKHKLMIMATCAEEPWIASVYYSFDRDLNLFFLSSPTTLHCRHLENNKLVAVAITDSSQKVRDLKKGLQLVGTAERVSDIAKIKHCLRSWKEAIGVDDPELTYENMIAKVVNGRMYRITPTRIKFFNEELFPGKDGEEPVLEL